MSSGGCSTASTGDAILRWVHLVPHTLLAAMCMDNDKDDHDSGLASGFPQTKDGTR